ncbi:MAG: twin-arginine translocase TatA/TatE family subunit [Myxococcota bacterium]
MFGIGGPELIIILIIALLFVGPDKLPQVAKTLGTGLRDLRRAANLAQAELRGSLDELTKEIERPLEPTLPPRAAVPPSDVVGALAGAPADTIAPEVSVSPADSTTEPVESETSRPVPLTSGDGVQPRTTPPRRMRTSLSGGDADAADPRTANAAPGADDLADGAQTPDGEA